MWRCVGTSLALLLAGLRALAAPPAMAAQISGRVFEDRNGDGTRGAADPGLSGWIVYVDANSDGVLNNLTAGDGTCSAQAAEPCVRTDSGDEYVLAGLAGGVHRVREVLQPGWQHTTPAFADLLLVSDAAVVANVDFGNFQLGSIEGQAFEDANGNGSRDPGEPGLRGWTVFADDNLNGRVDDGEIRAVTDASGTYALRGLSLGAYAVRERPRCGFTQSFPPPPGRHSLTISTSGIVIGDRDFGNQRPTVLPGDGNGDAVVSSADLVAVARALSGAVAATGADANLDGSISRDDLDATASNIFECADFTALPSALPTASSTATPPPSATQPSGSATPTPTPTLSRTPTVTSTTEPTVTPTATPSTTPSASRTPSQTAAATTTVPPTPAGGGDTARAVAEGAVAVANGMAAIPSVVTALVSGLQYSGGAAAALNADPATGGAAGACPLGGQATRSCTGLGSVTLTLTLSACRVATPSGSVTVDGTITLQGSGFCPTAVLPPWNATVNVEATFRDASSTLLVARADLTGMIAPQLGGSCAATGATLTLNGMLGTQFPGSGTVNVGFTSTSVGVAVAAFNTQCVPVSYTLTFNGPATLSTTAGGGAGGAAAEPVAVTFNAFTIAQQVSQTTNEMELDGVVSARCFGGAMTLDTVEPLTQVVGAPCPNAGTIQFSGPTGLSRIQYANGMVSIDANADGVSERTLPSCVDFATLFCVSGQPPTITPTITATATSSPTRTPTIPAGVPTATQTATATLAVTPPVSPTPSRTPTTAVPPAPTATPTSSPTPTATSLRTLYCDSLPVPAIIPDNDPAGVSNTITITDNVVISDLNVWLDIAHTWVGDLVIDLTHIQTGSSVRLMDRVGTPVLASGCNRDDVAVALDDQGPRPVQDECLATTATIQGRLRPTGPLNVFNGQSLAGSWRLTVSDNAPSDTGSLLAWCLEVNAPASPPPVVTGFTCNGDVDCVIAIDEPFTLSFSFTDPDANASSWRIIGQRDDGVDFSLAQGLVTPPSGSGTVPLSFAGFTCSQGNCPTTAYEFSLVVSDATRVESGPANVQVVVLGSQ